MVQPIIADKLLFPEILWQLPQNLYQRHGNILFIGGSVQHVAPLLAAAEATFALGRPHATLAVPESVQHALPSLGEDVTVLGCPETPSGTLSKESEKTITEAASGQDMTVLGLGLSRQEESQQLARTLARTIKSPLILLDDGLEAVSADDLKARSAPSLGVVDTGSFGRLLKRSRYTKHEPRPIVEHLFRHAEQVVEEISRDWKTTLALAGPTVLVGSPDGRVVLFPKLAPDLVNSHVSALVGLTATLALFAPTKLFECVVVALGLIREAGERGALDPNVPRGKLAAELPSIILELEEMIEAEYRR